MNRPSIAFPFYHVIACLAAAVFVLGGCTGGDGFEPMSVEVSGVVVDSRGDPVPMATVTFERQDGSTSDVVLETGLDGAFSGVVVAGDYLVTIKVGGETISEQIVTIEEQPQVDLGALVPDGGYFPWYEDLDGDAYGTTIDVISADVQPLGYAPNFDDCDDTNALINPGAIEVCNTMDDNCDGSIDEGVQETFYADMDADTYGDVAATTLACAAPAGFVADNTDCDDTQASVNPGATEVCNEIDDTCDGQVDEGVQITFFRDADSDLFGVSSEVLPACTLPDGYAAVDGDCNDNDANVNPDATEVCNGADDNCDSVIDEGVTQTFFADADSDGFGNALVNEQRCAAPAGFVSDDTDCDDTSAAIYPGAPEVCNGLDDNCNAETDEGVTATFYADNDGDTYGNPVQPVEACSLPAGYSADNTDCDDTNSQVNPETLWYQDGDGDTYPLDSGPVMQCEAPGGGSIADFQFVAFDCDDSNPTVNPGLIETLENGIDDDCNSATSDAKTLFADSDLGGTWKYFAMNAGDYTVGEWNGWAEGQIVFNGSGAITDFFTIYDDGTTETTSGPSLIRLTAEGIVTAADDPTLHGAISQDKDMIVGTYSDIEGGVTMFVMHKALADAAVADFAGDWVVHGLLAGDDPQWSGWIRGTSSIDSTGFERFDFKRSDNEIELGVILNDFDADGTLQTLWHRRSVSADKQMAIGRLQYEGGFGIELLGQAGGAFAPGNLEGDWSFHALAAGDAPQVNAWRHGTIEFDGAGNGTLKLQLSSNPDVPFAIDMLVVDSAGNIISPADSTFSGALTRNKDTIIASYTDDTGAANLFVALRRDPPPLDIVSEELGSTTAVVSPSTGDTLQATASDGTVFQLEIPAGSIDSENDIQVKMTPLATIGNLPATNPFLGAVGLAPDGLAFEVPARLTIQLPFAVPINDLVAYHFDGGGKPFSFLPVFPPDGVVTSDSYTIEIPHFSSGGVGSGPVPGPGESSLIPVPSQGQYESGTAAIIQQEGVRPLDPNVADDARIIERLRSNFEAWLNDWVLNRVARAEADSTVQSVEDALVAFDNWYARILDIARKYKIWGAPCACPPYNWAGNVELVFPGQSAAVLARLAAVIDQSIEDLTNQCYQCSAGQPPECNFIDPCVTGRSVINQLIPWIDVHNALHGTWSFYTGRDVLNPKDACGGLPQRLAGSAQANPKGAWIGVNETAVFKVLLLDMTSIDALDPTFVASDDSVVSTSSEAGVPTTLEVFGQDAGQAKITAYDNANCPALTLPVIVDASGVWNVEVSGRAQDNCHFDEPPDFTPIPVLLNPTTVSLTIDPYVVPIPENPDAPPIRYFTLRWFDSNSFYEMSGDSGDSPSNTASIRIAGGDWLRTDGTSLFIYRQGCDLEFGQAEFTGSCTFNKLESSGPISSDVCKGKYWIQGSRIPSQQ